MPCGWKRDEMRLNHLKSRLREQKRRPRGREAAGSIAFEGARSLRCLASMAVADAWTAWRLSDFGRDLVKTSKWTEMGPFWKGKRPRNEDLREI